MAVTKEQALNRALNILQDLGLSERGVGADR